MREHVFSRTDTLETLSARYGVPVCMIVRANRLGEGNSLHYGQRLQIPPADYCARMAESETTPEVRGEERRYLVQQGDTVYSIAERFNTTMGMVLEANQATDPTQIRPGQEIVVPCLPDGFVVYSLQPMDTLELVAERFGVSKQSILRQNRIGGVYPGMQLIIPLKQRRRP